MKHGWYSFKQSKFGTFIWVTPNGKQVEVTDISDTSDPPNENCWDDLRYVGEVVDFVRQAKETPWYLRDASASML